MPDVNITPGTPVSLDGRTLRSVSNTSNGDVGAETTFHYHQEGSVVWAEYSGGSVVRGSLIATALPPTDGSDGSHLPYGGLDMRYHHVNGSGELMTGRCRATIEVLEDGRVRMKEDWEWTSGDCSRGTSVVEEAVDTVKLGN